MVDFEISTPIFNPESNRSDHKTLYIGVGYLASFTSGPSLVDVLKGHSQGFKTRETS